VDSVIVWSRRIEKDGRMKSGKGILNIGKREKSKM